MWFEQRLLGGRARLKLGQVDANGEFGVVQSAGEFINASAGFSPTRYGRPTYPDPVPSVNVFLLPAAQAGRLGFGYWRHSGHAPVFGGGMQRAPQGWYATPEAHSGLAFEVDRVLAVLANTARERPPFDEAQLDDYRSMEDLPLGLMTAMLQPFLRDGPGRLTRIEESIATQDAGRGPATSPRRRPGSRN